MKCTYDILRFARFTFEDGIMNGRNGIFVYSDQQNDKAFTNKIKCIPKNHKEAENIVLRTDLDWQYFK